jgi:hypothetical protein
MRNPFAAPRTIRRIAARRVFQRAGRHKNVVLTLGVPQPVPGSDWGCAMQITGVKTDWNRPRYVFGIDGLQALHLAMQAAGASLESCGVRLEFLGQSEDLMMPEFLPPLPKLRRKRIVAFIERELEKFVAEAEKRHAARQRADRKRTS